MKGDSNLTFFLTQESGPKSPREGQGDVCMVSHILLVIGLYWIFLSS